MIMLLAIAGDFHIWFAQQLFDAQGSQWLLRNHWLTEDLLHRGVRNLNTMIIVALLVAIVWRIWVNGLTDINQRRLKLLASLLASFALVAYLKYVLQMDCPWDLERFGGSKPYYPLWAVKPTYISAGQCFPAGHASIGFAYIALYFYWRPYRPFAAKIALICALTLGTLLGFTQQLRGAHFFIDDISTAVICSVVAWLIFNGNTHDKTTL